MLEASNNNELPAIPGKRYFTIGEVSDLCGVKPHVLRYWEQEFPQLKPVKRRGNRRYYQRHDVIMIRQIRSLLYEQGFTIGGARQRLSGEEAKEVSRLFVKCVLSWKNYFRFSSADLNICSHFSRYCMMCGSFGA
jgi:DNA-binding transcriptional MerR regulator